MPSKPAARRAREVQRVGEQGHAVEVPAQRRGGAVRLPPPDVVGRVVAARRRDAAAVGASSGQDAAEALEHRALPAVRVRGGGRRPSAAARRTPAGGRGRRPRSARRGRRVRLQAERDLQVVLAHDVHDQGHPLVLPAAGAPPDRRRAGARLADPARVLLEQRRSTGRRRRRAAACSVRQVHRAAAVPGSPSARTRDGPPYQG